MSFRFASEGRLVGQSGGHVITWDPQSGKELSRVRERGEMNWLGGGYFNVTGDQLLYIEDDFLWWDSRTKKETRVALDPKRDARDVYWNITPDSQLYMTWGSGTFSVRSTATGKVVYSHPQPNPNPPPPDKRFPPGPLPEFANSPDCKRLSLYQLGDIWDTFVILDLTKAAPPIYLAHERDARVMAFSPDGRFLATAGSSYGRYSEQHPGMVTIYAAATGRKLKCIPLSDEQPHAMSFSPDGRTVAVVCAGKVLLIDAEAAKVKASFPTCSRTEARNWNTWGQHAPAWSPSGRLLGVQTADERLMVWDVTRLGGR